MGTSTMPNMPAQITRSSVAEVADVPERTWHAALQPRAAHTTSARQHAQGLSRNAEPILRI
jgi:hypothetical protein